MSDGISISIIMKQVRGLAYLTTGLTFWRSSHVVHCILAVWALGADEAIINETDSSYLSETYPSPNPISTLETPSKFHNHQGRYWSALLSREVQALEEDILSREFNFSKDGEPLHMLDRFISGLLRPFIRYEFDLLGIVAEGTNVMLDLKHHTQLSGVWSFESISSDWCF